ncbi:MAG: hypothetical protein KDB79_10720 [Acidobacteria bacterium]|nr:hypothetical protein [Acidobacteriota bacterium]
MSEESGEISEIRKNLTDLLLIYQKQQQTLFREIMERNGLARSRSKMIISAGRRDVSASPGTFGDGATDVSSGVVRSQRDI